MTKQEEYLRRRKRVSRLKHAIVFIALALILISITMNIVLCIRVVELNQMVQQLYGL